MDPGGGGVDLGGEGQGVRQRLSGDGRGCERREASVVALVGEAPCPRAFGLNFLFFF